MSNNVFIHHHLGLGDHFHCNGVVRFLIKNKYANKKIKLFAKKKYNTMVKFMYRDIENLEVVSISNDEKKEIHEVNSYITKNDIIEKIGFDYFVENKNDNKTIDMIFYEQFKIDYSKRFEFTYWKRDLIEEENLYNKLVKKENYAFVHDDQSRDFVIKDENISDNLQIIRNSNEYSIFDYSKIIENAKEIHVMESSTRCMLEYLNTKNSKHFLYKFKSDKRGSIPFYNDNEVLVGSSKKWKIVNINNVKKNKFITKIKNYFYSK
ncbi:hypothetical protein IDH32_04585 [Pelagibacterales bacterium SAG-MED01]|nr:hypothetical protein [Pelagibacterales bacterium SAG-MED01]